MPCGVIEFLISLVEGYVICSIAGVFLAHHCLALCVYYRAYVYMAQLQRLGFEPPQPPSAKRPYKVAPAMWPAATVTSADWLEDFKIELDSYNGAYRPGDTVTGSIHITLKRPVEAERITLSTNGKAECGVSKTSYHTRYYKGRRYNAPN